MTEQHVPATQSDRTLTPEVWRRERGHAFYPPSEVLRNVPAIYATDGIPCEHKAIHAHYFAAWGDWYVAEFDPVSGEAFGWARLGADDTQGEWGYFDLPALESHRSTSGLPNFVERDLDFERQLAADCLPKGRRRLGCDVEDCVTCAPQS
ncbi:hypothetical protein [Streptomyces sp. NBRC 110465]|uniref:hypothetical protein n=1 Tax=Streptomyces sp. NBRC 110465 TaxID=1897621 RepID=UPI00093537A7|nr:hypothetical protein [Streptomyces sp. NBRC 110465]